MRGRPYCIRSPTGHAGKTEPSSHIDRMRPREEAAAKRRPAGNSPGAARAYTSSAAWYASYTAVQMFAGRRASPTTRTKGAQSRSASTAALRER